MTDDDILLSSDSIVIEYFFNQRYPSSIYVGNKICCIPVLYKYILYIVL